MSRAASRSIEPTHLHRIGTYVCMYGDGTTSPPSPPPSPPPPPPIASLKTMEPGRRPWQRRNWAAAGRARTRARHSLRVCARVADGSRRVVFMAPPIHPTEPVATWRALPSMYPVA